jgi:hypothetical protein
MAEQHDLTTPIAATGGTSFWKVRLLTMFYDGDESYIKVGLAGENGEQKSVGYTGSEAETLIRALNKADLSTKSLHRRILEKLADDDKIGPGTQSGTPD